MNLHKAISLWTVMRFMMPFGPMMRLSFRLCSLVIISGLILACNGDIGPDHDEIRNTLSEEIAPNWKIDSFKVEAMENQGTKVEPRIRGRFTASVATPESLFRRVGVIDGHTIIREVSPKGQQVTLHGYSLSSLSQGKWVTRIEIEGRSLPRVGQQRKAFGSLTVIDGSSELREFEKRRAGRIASSEIKWRELLSRGLFGGVVSSGSRRRQSILVSEIKMFDGRRFSGLIEFQESQSVHKLRGAIEGETLIFENFAAIRPGRANLNCRYRVGLRSDDAGFGTFACGGSPGTIEIQFDSPDVSVRKITDRKAILDAFRKELAGTWTSDAPVRNKGGEIRGSEQHPVFFQIEFPGSSETQGVAIATVLTHQHERHRASQRVKFDIFGGEVRWITDGQLVLMRDIHGNTPWIWSTSNSEWLGRIEGGKLYIRMAGGSRIGGGWSATLSKQ